MACQIMLSVLLLGMINVVTSQVVRPLYPISGTTSPPSDDGSSPRIDLQRSFVYFGQTYDQIYVNQNGHLTFDSPVSSYTPQTFPMHGSRDFIAPFWTDLDNRQNGQIYYNQYTSGSVLQQATQDIDDFFPSMNFSANWVFVATWYEVAYYPNSGTRTTFQAVLISGGQHTFVLLNYGIIASTSQNVQAGYDTINSIYHFTIPGSFSSAATGSNSNFRLSSNVNVPGCWAFRTDNGSRDCTFNGETVQLGDSFWPDSTCAEKCTCTSAGLQCHNQPCSFSQICQPSAYQFSCQNVQRGTCTISGDPHYYTFDNTVFHFQGSCTYVLSEQCDSKLPYYRVEGKNEHRGSTHASWTQLVKIYVYNETIELVKGHHAKAKVNGSFAATPLSLNNGTIQVYESGFSVIVSTDFGLVVSYDTNHHVRIGVPYSYQNATCGLCGNFNGIPQDDFQTRQGELPSSDVDFANSWKASGYDEPGCEVQCEGLDCIDCIEDQKDFYSNTDHCGILQNSSGPFAVCHQQLPPQSFVESCVYDLCVAGGYQPILCQALNVYASQCQQNGVQLPNWRRRGFCGLDCLANSHYEQCGTDCGKTCASSINATCEQVCSEGCFCDEGFVRSGMTCVPVESCGCQYNGFYYNAGESFWTDGCSQRCECHAPNDLRCSATPCNSAQECTIRNGQLGCFSVMSTCTVWGDPHYITFDGALAHFQGTCSYIITESVSHNTSETQFQVVATNNHRGNNRVSFVSTVDIYLSNHPESEHIRIGPNKRVTVNGSEVSLPTTAGTLAQVVRQGSYTVVDAIDLIVQFDGQSTLLVRMGQNRKNRVTGMCGNFNDDVSDDKVLPNGTLAQNDNHFGHSWKAPTSQPGCGSSDDENVDGLNNCPFIEEYSELCSVITNTSGPFSACHLHSDPQPFFSSCVYDLCLYTPANGMLCSAVSAYERTCSLLGLNIPEWHLALQCAQSDPCEQLDCTDYEWCGQKDGVYGCFCDEHHHRPNNESYDSFITCVSSSGTISVSRCQLFEAGFHLGELHLRDESCNGTLQDGRLVFHFNNDDQLCGTILRSNGTHFMYENTIQGDVEPHQGLISREKSIRLHFSCEYPLAQALSMNVGINPVESIAIKKLPSGLGRYHLRMIPYEDAGFSVPLTRNRNVEMEIDQRLYIEVQTEGVDSRQISTILDSCWATPFNDASYPVRWDLITRECPNPADGTVEVIQNGVSTAARFSFRMFTFTNYSSIYLHCQVHLCLLTENNCSAHCYSGYHTRVARDISMHDTATIFLGPLITKDKSMLTSSASDQFTPW